MEGSCCCAMLIHPPRRVPAQILPVIFYLVLGIYKLLPGWFVTIDEDSGDPYCCNEVTGETTWDPPTTTAATATTSTNVANNDDDDNDSNHDDNDDEMMIVMNLSK